MPRIPRIKTTKTNNGNGTNNFRYVMLVIVLIAAMNALWYHQSTLQALRMQDVDDGTVCGGAGDALAATTAAITANNNNNYNYNPKRVCEQNPYAESLSMPLSEYPQQMETWLEHKIRIEHDLQRE